MKKLVISMFIVLFIVTTMSFVYGVNDVLENSTYDVLDNVRNSTVDILEGKQVRRNIKNKRRYAR